MIERGGPEHWATRAFPEAQRLLAGAADSRLESFVDLGWYDSAVEAAVGSYAVVRTSGPLTHLVGDVISVLHEDRRVFAYVYGQASVTEDIALYRRAFLHLAPLAAETLPTLIEVLA